jgi:hypothetical protein
MPSVASNMAPLCGFKMCESNSRSPGFLATVIGVMRSIIANLMPASGHQDHTTSPSAGHTPVKRAARVHRIPPDVPDVAQRPSERGGTARDMQVIWPRGQEEFGKSETGRL